MENNLLHNIRSYFTDEVMNKLATHLGENKEQIHKGIDIVVPSLLLGLQSRNNDGLSSILQSAKHLFSNFDMHDTLGRYFAHDDRGERAHFESDNLVGEIFGDKLQGIIQSISKYLGMKPESIHSIFGASTPAVISGITSKGGHWDTHEIAQQLNSNRSSFASAIPAGLGLGTFGTMFANADTARELQSPDPNRPSETATTSSKTIVHTKEAVQASKGTGWRWIIILIAGIALWIIIGRSCGTDKDSASETRGVDTTMNNSTVDSMNSISTLIDAQLPDGKAFKAYSSGIEEQLIQFLQSDYKSWTDEQLAAKWFDFDNLNFDTETANISPSSRAQLDNIVNILRAFPDAKIKIGGYTDRRGDEAINKRVSQERADAVNEYLNSQGVGSQVVGAEGYGSEFAQAAWDASDKERAKDRRVSLSVRK